MNEFSQRDQSVYVLGLLGYDHNHLTTALELLEFNTLDIIKDFYYTLEIHNMDYKTSSYISLAGSYPKIKLKNGDFDKVFDLVKKCNIKIPIE